MMNRPLTVMLRSPRRTSSLQGPTTPRLASTSPDAHPARAEVPPTRTRLASTSPDAHPARAEVPPTRTWLASTSPDAHRLGPGPQTTNLECVSFVEVDAGRKAVGKKERVRSALLGDLRRVSPFRGELCVWHCASSCALNFDTSPDWGPGLGVAA